MAETLNGKRILIVEDEYFIAFDLKRTLRSEGVEVVGPANSLETGLSFAVQPLDAALLDVNLTNASSYPIADYLATRGVPYILLTGYDGWSLPDKYRDVARITKPFAPQTLVAMIEHLLSARETRS